MADRFLQTLSFFRAIAGRSFSPSYGARGSRQAIDTGRAIDAANADKNARYKISRLKTMAHRAIGSLPPVWRERAAERFLRRPGAPAPAAEHFVQYLLSAERARAAADAHKGAVVAKGADHFYERQYRQYFNPAMGAFAMTATMAALGGGHPARGHLWSFRRKTCAAMLDADAAGGPPIIVIDARTVGIPMLLPRPRDKSEGVAIARWLGGNGPMPERYRDLARGEEARCREAGARAYVRSAQGALLELLETVAHSRKLAVLALHPHDPDAMGLHVTLFDVRCLTGRFVEQDHGLGECALEPWRRAAESSNAMLLICVGATEEVFTQCSQNLFVRRRLPEPEARFRATQPKGWLPDLPLERLLDAQFEMFQVTVSASGLPGASPRNGDRGKTAFTERRDCKTYVLIPYHPGNAVHGHAAKLWSNPQGSLIIWDDTTTCAAVTISGPSRVVTHAAVKRDFPNSAARAATITRRNGSPAPDPEYWFLQEVAEIACLRETLAPSALDPARPTCAINAGGHALFDKKPAYFAAGALPPYDMELQHRREATGRPIDPSGAEHLRWNESVRDALLARLTHLDSLR